MSVVPQRSDQTKSKSVEPQRPSLKERVANAKAGTKDATRSAGGSGVGAWWKSILGGKAKPAPPAANAAKPSAQAASAAKPAPSAASAAKPAAQAAAKPATPSPGAAKPATQVMGAAKPATQISGAAKPAPQMKPAPHMTGAAKPAAQAAGAAMQATDQASVAKTRASMRLAQLAGQTKAQTTHAVAAGKVGLERAAKIGREKVLPELERTGAKLRERTRPERLKSDYRRYLFWLHERVLDVSTEQLFFKPTKDPVPLKGLTIRGPNRAHGHDYKPSPCSLFEWTMGAIDYDFSRLTFVDYGAGKGRVLLLASQYPFAAVGGIEFAEELHDDAVMNIAQFPRSRMKCRNVECVLDDATAIGPPEGESVNYFFNPFSREAFAEVLHNLVVSYRQRPRRLYLILVDPIATDLVDQSGVFSRLQLPFPESLKVKLLSPYEIALYRSLA